VFPNPHDTPVEPAQFTGHLAITLPVAGDFGIPKYPVRFRAAITAGTTVPEAAIHKQRQPVPPKKKIGLAEDFLMPAPAGDVVLAQQFHQCKLGVFIAMPAYTGHDGGAFRLGKNVRHGRIPTKAPPVHAAGGFRQAWDF
jgi:hypothetical protein